MKDSIYYRTTHNNLPRYDISRTYDWNYVNAPDRPPDVEVPTCVGNWPFCGIPIGSPLGIAAGPLLNSQWILYYAALGFNVLTYKTVRSRFRPCYNLPNLLPVDAPALTGSGDKVTALSRSGRCDSWAISFGMPSKDPAVWRDDVARARTRLPRDHVLVVSVVASPEPDWSLEQIAADFACCARWARDSGADAIEANLSCPNVTSKEGGLYQSPEASGLIAAEIRQAIGKLPLILKIGLFENTVQAEAVVTAVRESATAVDTTNGISAVVAQPEGTLAFDGQSRGIGGLGIRDRCLAEAAMCRKVIERYAPELRIIGVGGIFTARDVRDRLSTGAHHVELATAAMLDPTVGIRIRQELVLQVTNQNEVQVASGAPDTQMKTKA